MNFTGTPIKVSQYMEGCKRAVKSGDVIFVSPAMYSLMKDSTSDELEHLLKNIEMIDIGKFSVRDPMSVQTIRPVPLDGSYKRPNMIRVKWGW